MKKLFLFLLIVFALFCYGLAIGEKAFLLYLPTVLCLLVFIIVFNYDDLRK